MYDYYSADDITRAKDRIVGDMAKLQIDGLSCVYSRSDSANRSRLEIDRHVLANVLDERALIDKSSSCATTDSSCVPSSRLDGEKYTFLLCKLEKMLKEIRLNQELI